MTLDRTSNKRMTKEEFRAIRLELGLSQQDLAKRLGLKYQPNVNRIEKRNGPSGPVAAHMRTLLKIYRESSKIGLIFKS